MNITEFPGTEWRGKYKTAIAFFLLIFSTIKTCKLSIDVNEWVSKINKEIKLAVEKYVPCKKESCDCYKPVINQDLAPFNDGISKEMFALAGAKGTKYQVNILFTK